VVNISKKIYYLIFISILVIASVFINNFMPKSLSRINAVDKDSIHSILITKFKMEFSDDRIKFLEEGQIDILDQETIQKFRESHLNTKVKRVFNFKKMISFGKDITIEKKFTDGEVYYLVAVAFNNPDGGEIPYTKVMTVYEDYILAFDNTETKTIDNQLIEFLDTL